MNRFVPICVFFALLSFVAGLSFGDLIRSGRSELVTELNDRQLEVDLMFYQRKLKRPSYTGCQMSIDDFRKYHALNDERKRRAVE